jgi:hypothetical protein
MINLQALSTAFKDTYQEPLANQLNDASAWGAQIERNSEGIVGLEAKRYLKLTRSGGFGARGEGQALPDAPTGGGVQKSIQLRKLTGRDTITLEALKRSESGEVAYLNGAKQATDGIRDSAVFDYNRQLLGTSDGVICTTKVNTDTATLAVNATEAQVTGLFENMRIDIGTINAVTGAPTIAASGLLVVEVNENEPKTIALTMVAIALLVFGFDDSDPTAVTVTVNSAITTAEGDKVFVHGAAGAKDHQLELTGLQTITDDAAALHGVDPTVAGQRNWSGYVNENGGTLRDPSNALINKGRDKIARRSGVAPKLGVCGDGVFRKAEANQVPQVRYAMGDQDTLKAGVVGLEIGGVTLFKDRFAPSNQLHLVDPDVIELAVNGDWEFEEGTDGIFRHIGDLKYEVALYAFREQVTTHRNHHGVIKDLSEA